MNANDQKRIEKSSLYFQVGLSLSLILAYLFIEIEFQTVTKDTVLRNREVDIREVYNQKFIVEKLKVTEPIVEKRKPKFVNKVKLVEQTKPDEKDPVETTTPVSEPTPDKPKELVESIPLPIPTKPDFFERGMVEESPTFMICAQLKGIERDKCFNEQLQKFLLSNLNYPDKALNNGIEGSIAVQFIIDKYGAITHVKTINTNHKELEKEALRVVSKLPKMKPGRQGNEAVNVRYTLPITFKIPKK